MAVKKYLEGLNSLHEQYPGMDAMESSFIRDVVCVVLNLFKCI